MKIALCGAGGMLAGDLRDVLLAQGHNVISLTSDELDITCFSQVQKCIGTIAPSIVINAAAYTNVDECESEQDLAYRVNALGPRNLAITCNEVGAALVQFSTDYVFGGSGKTPFREYDTVNPQSVYGKSKLDGEVFVRNHCARHFIVRTAWLFGQHGNNFVKTMLRLASEREVLQVVDDQTGSPTHTKDLADAISSLINRQAYGTYHLTNSGSCTWFEFARQILKQAGIKNVRVEPITTEELNRPANRPRFSVLDNFVWRVDGNPPLRHYEEALAEYLAITKKNISTEER